jgi:hypothetical protein
MRKEVQEESRQNLIEWAIRSHIKTTTYLDLIDALDSDMKPKLTGPVFKRDFEYLLQNPSEANDKALVQMVRGSLEGYFRAVAELKVD